MDVRKDYQGGTPCVCSCSSTTGAHNGFPMDGALVGGDATIEHRDIIKIMYVCFLLPSSYLFVFAFSYCQTLLCSISV
jgi:hypothetical protein